MLATPLAAWIRPALALLATAGVLTLSACGGGSGAPNNPYVPPPTTPGPLSVVPGEATAYAGTPLVLSIAGGVPPYTAFSANPAALPVPQNVNGSTLTLLANNVDTAQTANVTIRDTSGQTATAEVTVRPAVLLPASLTITPNAAPCSGGDVCSGQTSVASVRVTGAGGMPLSGRSVRFDVVQGQFTLQTTNPGSPQAATQTVVSDANGEARVIIAVAAATPTQIGLLRATELSTGSQVTSQFIIQQVTDAGGVLSVVPNGNTTINGPQQNICSAGVRVTHYIFGGTPPYRVQVNFPDLVNLVGVPVLVNGGGFDVITNGGCFQNLTFAITDATGRTLLTGIPTVSNVPGTTVPTPPAALAIVPGSVTVAGTATQPCTSNRTYQFVVTGGTQPYSAVLSPNTGWINGGFSGNTLTVSGPGDTTISVADALGQTATATITCTAPAAP